uniref:Sushi domain-containing protein n=1 Tax=Plectus sambesii TaxID=2011161 RepID=A0A914VTT5_9BILA
MATGYCFTVVVFIIIDLMLEARACMQTIPVTDILQTCLIRSTPFGTFSPAAGNRVPDGGTAALTCNPFTRLDGTVTTATCSAGVLSSTSLCVPCPDDTWVYDRTTNRCFKAFAGPTTFAPCTGSARCAVASALVGAPLTLAYTFNFQALIDAGLIGINAGVGGGIYYTGIGDPNVNFQYEFNDGTLVPLPSILPYFLPNNPSDTPANAIRFLNVRNAFGSLGVDDDVCFGPPFNDAICQLQL